MPTSKSTVATHANIFSELQDFTESCRVAYQHPSASSSISLSLDMIQMNEMTSGLAETIRTVAVVWAVRFDIYHGQRNHPSRCKISRGGVQRA